MTIPTNAGNAVWTGGVLYAYWPKGSNDLAVTSDITVAYASANVPLAAYRGGDLIDARLGKTQIIGDLIRTGAIDATKLSVEQLSAIAANLGNVTAGTMTGVSLTLDIAGSTSKLRIDSAGIYVSQDGGATWRKFLAIDEYGDLVLSFDVFADDADIQGVATTAAPAEIVYTDATVSFTSSGWTDWLPLPWTTRDESREVILVDLYGTDTGGGLTDVSTQIRLEDADGYAVWTSDEFAFTDLPGSETLLTFKLPLPVYTTIAKHASYRAAVRVRLDGGVSASLRYDMTMTAPAADTMKTVTIARAMGDANTWSAWEKTLLTGMALKREMVFITAQVTDIHIDRDVTAVQIGLFDASGTLITSREFSYDGTQAPTPHTVVTLGSLNLRDYLTLGDQYTLGARAKADAAASFDVTLKKSSATTTGGLVKE